MRRRRVALALALALAFTTAAQPAASAHPRSNSGWSPTKLVKGHHVSHRHVARGTLCRIDGSKYIYRLASLHATNRDCLAFGNRDE